MKKEKIISIVLFAFLIAIGAAVLLTHQLGGFESTVQNQPTDENNNWKLINDSSKATSSDASVLNQNHGKVSEAKMENPEGHQTEETIQAGMRTNVPIAFYGKVVDQYDQPVPGAAVTLRVQRAVRIQLFAVTAAQIPNTTSSDADGKFQLTGTTGSLVAVETIKKSGYEYADPVSRIFRYPAESLKADPTKPVVFKVWKKQGADRLIVHEKGYSLVPDGRQFTFDFLAQTKAEGPQTEGDLVVSIECPLPINTKKGFDWSFTLTGVRGGVIETSDEYPNLAPASGYLSTIKVQMTPNDNFDVRKQFYVQSRDGKQYSRIEVDVYPYRQDSVWFSIKSYVNPTGSRNLEYDPRQLSDVTQDHFPPE